MSLNRPTVISIVLCLGSGFATAQSVNDTQLLPIPSVNRIPVVDGDLSEWGNDGWSEIPLQPAVKNDDKNLVGEINVMGKASHHDGRIYFAFRWPDSSPDLEYKNWIWRGNRYRRGKESDDMFALRFEMSGDYDSCMLSKKSYEVDVWLWSAGRSDHRSYADDMTQLITTDLIENAAEHEGPDGQIVYIKKRRDAGEAGYTNTRPDRRKKTAPKLPGIEPTSGPSGSLADVAAKGLWKDGYWHLEMSRRLDTGHDDDVILKPGEEHRGAIAVFNRGGSQHKSNSETLRFKIMP